MPLLVAEHHDIDARVAARLLDGARGFQRVDAAERAVEPARVVLAFEVRAGQRLARRSPGDLPRMLPMPSMVVSSPAAVHCSANHWRAAMSSGEKVGRCTPVL